MPYTTVIATAHGVVPRPAGMGPGARLVRAIWEAGGERREFAPAGFWWTATGPRHEHLRLSAGFEAGTQVTLEWT